MQDVAVIVVNYRTPDLTVSCLNALAAARGSFARLRIVVVDGCSGDASVDRIAAAIHALGDPDWIDLIPLPINGGFGFANNRGLFALALGGDLPEAVALINPDARVLPGALETMAALLTREPRAGAVGALLVHEDGRPQASAFRFPSVRGEFCYGAQTGAIDRLLGVPPVEIAAADARDVPWVTGAAVMFRTAALQDAGLFDEGFFLYYEETELMHRLRRRGWTIWHEPAARVFHAGGAATNIRDPETGQPLGRPMPRYWYQSRRRYFTATGGRSRALAANVAWLAGRSIWLVRAALTGAAPRGPANVVHDVLATGLWPSAADARPAAPNFASLPPERPAWMDAAR